MDAIQISGALKRLRPGAAWTLHGNDLAGIEWADQGSARPTDEEITNAINAVAYRAERAPRYWISGDQFDAIIKTFKHLKTSGADIGPDGDALVAMSDAIKDQFPKP